MELVPLSAWGKNLRSHIKRSDWDKLRRQTISASNGKCAICGASRKYLICHEVWEYDDHHNIQRLKGLEALCWMCDRVKHFGNTETLILQGTWKPNLIPRLIRHFMQVNHCDKATFERQKRQAYQKWGDQSKHEWQLDFGPYSEIVKSSGSERSSASGLLKGI